MWCRDAHLCISAIADISTAAITDISMLLCVSGLLSPVSKMMWNSRDRGVP
jgi:hypothetical protein